MQIVDHFAFSFLVLAEPKLRMLQFSMEQLQSIAIGVRTGTFILS